jgi:hypothetical protein
VGYNHSMKRLDSLVPPHMTPQASHQVAETDNVSEARSCGRPMLPINSPG